jgi:hypothetical protein
MNLVAVEQPMPPREQIALKPTLAQVLRKHFHDPSVMREVFVTGNDFRVPCSIAGLEHRSQPI